MLTFFNCLKDFLAVTSFYLTIIQRIIQLNIYLKPIVCQFETFGKHLIIHHFV